MLPVGILPVKGLQRHIRTRQCDSEVVRIQNLKVAIELLHLGHQLLAVHFCKVLEPQVLDSVGEDCMQCNSLLACHIYIWLLHSAFLKVCLGGACLQHSVHKLYSPNLGSRSSRLRRAIFSLVGRRKQTACFQELHWPVL